MLTTGSLSCWPSRRPVTRRPRRSWKARGRRRTGVPRIRSSVVASQVDLHERYGGVVPEIASRAHVRQILPMIDEALRRAEVSLGDLDAVAVATRPGLVGCPGRRPDRGQGAGPRARRSR